MAPFQVPSTDHRRKYLYKVCQGGKSWGAIRQGQPARSTHKMPLTTSRRSTLCGRPPGLAGGSSGNRISHCSSVRSLGYGLRFMQAVSANRYTLETPSGKTRAEDGSKYNESHCSKQVWFG